MKISLLVSLALLPCVALAQSNTDTSSSDSTNAPGGSGGHHWHHRPMSPDQQLAMLTSSLQLSDIQQGQIKPVLVSRDTQMKSIFTDTSLSEDQKREQMKSAMESSEQQIESFLNPAQLAKYKAFHAQHMHHGGGGAPGTAPDGGPGASGGNASGNGSSQ
jgi:hypothetical protein